jgi:hypothetical protein
LHCVDFGTAWFRENFGRRPELVVANLYFNVAGMRNKIMKPRRVLI